MEDKYKRLLLFSIGGLVYCMIELCFRGHTHWTMYVAGDEESIVRDLVPCYRIADGVIGMYDLVNGVFYTNAGSGTFIKGEDV